MATAKKKTPAKSKAKQVNKSVFNDSQKNGIWLMFTVLIVLVAALFFYCTMYMGV